MVQKLHRRKTQAQRGVGNESRVRDQGTDRRHSRVHCRRVRTRGGNKAPLRLFTVVRVGKPCTRTLMQLLVDGLGKRALHALGRCSIEKCWAGNQLRGELDIKSLQCVDRSRQLRKPDGPRGRIRLRTQARTFCPIRRKHPMCAAAATFSRSNKPIPPKPGPRNKRSRSS